MITCYIRFKNGEETIRTVYRVEVVRDQKKLAVFDTPTSTPEFFADATVRVYVGSTYLTQYMV